MPFDPSVEGRYALYKASMEELLNPDQRIPKMFVLDSPIVIDIAPKLEILGHDLGLSLTIPAGFPAVDVNSLRYKDLIQDLVLVDSDPGKFETKYATLLSAAQRQELRDGLEAIRGALLETAAISSIELVAGHKEAVVGRAQDLTLQVGNDFVQRLLLEPARAPGERRPHLRRGAERAPEAGAHRLRGDALRAGGCSNARSA